MRAQAVDVLSARLTAGILVPGQTVGNRYHVIRLIGAGGMGSVYQAWDAELGIAVALKMIHPSVSAAPAAAATVERLIKRELLLARQVTHKHVVRIHDLGDIDGIKYITMPYVQGADLSTLIRQEGRLSVARTLRYVRQIASGLAAAHDVGIVHRDLKPANIMIDGDDQALIMDFGIARSDATTSSGASGIVGTLAYMAPEQAQGQSVDHRADIYALGMIFRELLVGHQQPAEGESAVADLMKRVQHAPARVRSVDATIPEPLDEIIARCLEPDPARRYRTTAALVRALDELDEHGHRRRATRAAFSWRGRLILAAALMALVVGVALVARRIPNPRASPAAIEPVSVLIANFDNRAKDPAFDGALEQSFAIALEGASFITAYPRRDALRLAKEIKAGGGLDDATARLVAFREGVKYVLAGSVSPSGDGFSLEVNAIDPSNGTVLRSAASHARSKSDVLTAVAAVAATLRIGLGDKTPDLAKRTAAETFTAGSLEAFREYAAAQDLANAGRDEEAVTHYRRAVAFDSAFGRAYSGLAISTQRLGRPSEATAAWEKALSLIDRMTDREKYRTLGAYYLGVAQNYEKAAENYGLLVSEYPADSAGYGNLALSHFYLRDFSKALDEGRRAVAINPKNVLQRNNLALYAMYAGDFAAGARDAKNVLAEQANYHTAYLPIAMDAAANGDLAAATRAFNDMAKSGARGASLASIGRADLALYAGQADSARSELQSGIAADLATGNTTGAALKQVALADLDAALGQRIPAAEAASAALKLTRQLGTLVPAARVFLRVGRAAEARAIASGLESQLQRQSRAYGKIVLAEIALEEGKTTEAADRLNEALQLADVWLGRFDLGVTYVQAGHFAEALPELELCEKRRGEATALFFDDVPTYRFLAPLAYWIGRAQEGLGMRGAAIAHYQRYLAIRADSQNDPLVADARRRVSVR
jgi:tetratricopeptide (TPR) repeat protein